MNPSTPVIKHQLTYTTLSSRNLAEIVAIEAATSEGPLTWWEYYLVHDEARLETGLTVGMDEGSVVGYTVAWFPGHPVSDIPRGTINLAKIAVLPSKQGLGYGRALLENVLESHADCDVRLIVRETNVVAISLYESSGFVEIGRDDVFRNLGLDEDGIWMLRGAMK